MLLYVRVNVKRGQGRQLLAGYRQVVTTPTQSLHHTLILLYLLRQLSVFAQLHLPAPSKPGPGTSPGTW